MQTNLKKLQPYGDMFDDTKNYHHVLFRHGDNVSLLAGELNEIQTMLQRQIGEIGKTIYKNGSIVYPGGIHVNKKPYMAFHLPLDHEKIEFPKSIFIDGKDVAIVDTLISDFVYVGLDTNQQLSMSYGTTLRLGNVDLKLADVGQCYVASIEEGIVFYDGFFIRFSAATIIPNFTIAESDVVSVGFNFRQTIVTEFDDISLYSHAQGFPNIRQAGAHRLRFDVVFGQPIKDHAYVELLSLYADHYLIKDQTSNFNIMPILETRTYEESGHYFIEHPKLSVMENFHNPIEGYYGKSTSGVRNKISLSISPYLGYIYGKRLQRLYTTWIDIEKPSHVDVYNNTYIQVNYNDKATCHSTKGVPATGIVKCLDENNVLLGEVQLFDFKQTGLIEYDLYLNKIYPTCKFIKPLDDSFLLTIRTLPASMNLLIDSGYDNVSTIIDFGVVYNQIFDGVINANGEFELIVGRDAYLNKTYQFESFITRWDDIHGVYSIYDNRSVGMTQVSPQQLKLIFPVSMANTKLRVQYPVECVDISIADINEESTAKILRFNSTESRTIALAHTNVHIKRIMMNDILDVTDKFTVIHHTNTESWLPDSLNYHADDVLDNVILSIEYSYITSNDGFDVIVKQSFPYESAYYLSDQSSIQTNQYLDFRSFSRLNRRMPRQGSFIRCDVSVFQTVAYTVLMNRDGDIAMSKSRPYTTVPIAPDIPLNTIPLFTFELVGQIKHTKIAVKDYPYKRYTMRDISEIDVRVETLEDTMSMTLLDKLALSFNTVDPVTGGMRFKNGFVTTGFKDTALVDMSDFKMAFDFDNGRLYANEEKMRFDLSNASVQSDGVGIFKGIASLPYRTELYMSQPVKSKAVTVKSSKSDIQQIMLNPTNDWIGDNSFTFDENKIPEQYISINNYLRNTDKVVYTPRDKTIEFEVHGLYPNAHYEMLVEDKEFGSVYADSRGIIASRLSLGTEFESHQNQFLNLTLLDASGNIAALGMYKTYYQDETHLQKRISFDLTAHNSICNIIELEDDCMITRYGIFFNKRDEFLPVFVCLKPVIKGIVQNKFVDNSIAWVMPDKVLLNTMSALETVFTLDNPVPLLKGEYAICVFSAGDYECFISDIDDTRLIADAETIKRYGQVGNLILTTGKNQFEDASAKLTFKLYSARLTRASGTLSFNVGKLYRDGEVVTIANTNEITLTLISHGFSIGDKVELTYNNITIKNAEVMQIIDGNNVSLLVNENQKNSGSYACSIIANSFLTNILPMLDTTESQYSSIKVKLDGIYRNGKTHSIITSSKQLASLVDESNSKDLIVTLLFETVSQTFSPVLNLNSSGLLVGKKMMDSKSLMSYFSTQMIKLDTDFKNIRVMMNAYLPGSVIVKLAYWYNNQWVTFNGNIQSRGNEYDASIELPVYANSTRLKFMFYGIERDIHINNLRIILFT